MISKLLLSMTSKQFIETIDYEKIKKNNFLEEKKNLYKEKYIKLKYSYYEGIHYELNREYINYFVWLKSFIHLDFIEINKENKKDIFNKYKLITHFLKYITNLYIEYFYSNNILDIDGDNIMNRKIIFNDNENTKDKKEHVLNIISKKYDFKIPHILYPNFTFDNFIYHRNSHFFTDEELIQTEKLFKIYEMFYFTLINHMEEYEFIITEINKEIL